MYDCNEFNNLAGIPMALPAPLTALIESMGLNSVLYLGFDGTPAASVDELMTESFQQRVDLVAINSELLNMQPAMRNALIAKCRDQLSTRVLLELDNELDNHLDDHLDNNDDTAMTETDCLALGFMRCAVTEQKRYYLFDLKTYKPAPDWLNPKFWANPQNWNKYRW